MRKSRFKDDQIVSILKQVEGGRLVKNVCRERGISETSYYIKRPFGQINLMTSLTIANAMDFEKSPYPFLS